ARPVDPALRPDLLLDAAGDGPDVRVPGLVSLNVVDLLQPIEVEREEREGRAVGVAPFDHRREVVLERAVVRETGEAVGAGDLREVLDLGAARVAVALAAAQARGANRVPEEAGEAGEEDEREVGRAG